MANNQSNNKKTAQNKKQPASKSTANKQTAKKQPDKKQPERKQPAMPKKPTSEKAAQAQTPAPVEKTPEAIAAGRQKLAIVLGAAAVLSVCLAFIKGESFWFVMHQAVFGIFGFCAYIIPVVLIYLAVVYAREKPLGSVAGNLVGMSGFLTLLCSAIHVFANEAPYLTDLSLVTQISDAWTAESLASGGVVGAVVGGLIAHIFGKTGGSIIIIVLLLMLLMLLTGTTLRSLSRAVTKPVQKAVEITNDRFERRRAAEETAQGETEQTEPASESEKPGKVKEKQTFGPPATPTVTKPDQTFSDQFVTDESTFAPVHTAESDIPPLPTVNAKPDGQSGEEKKQKPRKKRQPSEQSASPFTADNTEQMEFDGATPPEAQPAYVFPPIDCLNRIEKTLDGDNMTEMQMGAQKLLATLESFKIKSEIVNITRGPAVTRYELVPEAGVRINRITNLSKDIALRLAAKSVRIEAPIPGKSAIGIEVPNSAKSMVSIREVLETEQFRNAKSKLNVALGKDITGNTICADLAKMPHLLVAGTTGSGKSVCLNAMIVSILYNATPEEVKLLMIDPKMVEFTVYNGIAHLEVPVVSNPRKAAGALGWAVSEMEKRYQLFAENRVRDIKGFNKLVETRPDLHRMHQIVIFIDELSDLMMVSPKEVEDSICRLAQLARAAGIHLVVATQRPSVDVITGIIKANIPSRIALSVSSQVDSRTILDTGGAEQLLGNGDMLFSPVGASNATRVQGCFISEEEVARVVEHIKSQSQAEYNEETMKEIETKAAAAESAKKKAVEEEDEDSRWDPVLNDAVELVVTAGQASTSMLQTRLRLGYNRARRVIDQLEEKGVIGPQDGSKPRAVLMTRQQWYEMQALRGDVDGAPDLPDPPDVDEEEDDEDFAPVSIDDVFADDGDYAGSDDF